MIPYVNISGAAFLRPLDIPFPSEHKMTRQLGTQVLVAILDVARG